MTNEQLMACFEDATLSEQELTHANHVRLGWLYLHDGGLTGALERFPAALRRYAATRGKHTLYHETITWAYLILIHERMATRPRDESWSGFAEANRDLLAWSPSILDRYYDRETLASPLARTTFLLPRANVDRQPAD